MPYESLPSLNAFLNALSAVWLGLGLGFIRRGRREAHRKAMLAAVVTSTLFLTSYVVYHLEVGSTPFQTRGWIRPVYYTLLLFHTVLAVTLVPLVIVTLSRALRGRFDRHRRIARITWPVWMTVSVTGVLVYLMLYHLDPTLSGPRDGKALGDPAGVSSHGSSG